MKIYVNIELDTETDEKAAVVLGLLAAGLDGQVVVTHEDEEPKQEPLPAEPKGKTAKALIADKPATEPAKKPRKRRTKAEIEAEKAASQELKASDDLASEEPADPLADMLGDEPAVIVPGSAVRQEPVGSDAEPKEKVDMNTLMAAVNDYVKVRQDRDGLTFDDAKAAAGKVLQKVAGVERLTKVPLEDYPKVIAAFVEAGG